MINIEKVKTKLKEIIKDSIFEGKVYLVGGCVRDNLLKLPIKDIDLIIDLPDGGVRLSKYIEDNYGSISKGFNIFERYGTARFEFLVDDDYIEIECVMPRCELYSAGSRNPIDVSYTSIYEDAIRRDFCCNALYQNVTTDEILDPTGKGISDLNNKVLMCPLDPISTFYDDPLRAFRAVRFQCQKGFSIQEEVLEAIKKVPSKQIEAVSLERINTEFNKILMSNLSVEGIKSLIDLGLMNYISEEFVKNWNFDQRSANHNLTSGKHSLLVLENAIKSNPETSLEVRLSCLFHDISKAYKYIVKEDRDPKFNLVYYGHEVDSAIMTKDILGRLKYSNKITDKVCFLVRNHMKIKSYNLDGHLKATPKQIRKVVRELGENLDECFELIDADNKSHGPNSLIIWQIDEFKEELKSINLPPIINNSITVPITGIDIMDNFKLTPSRLVGDLIKKAQDIYDENPNLSKEDILEILKKEMSD